MKKRWLLLMGICLSCRLLTAQSFDQYVNDACLITKMAEKYHVQPRPVDDTFSGNVFTGIFRQLDKDKIFFTAADMQALSAYRHSLDEEIKNKQSGFLKTLYAICEKRLPLVDSMIRNICSKPFTFSRAESFTRQEDTTYAADEKQLRTKLYKYIKEGVLWSILDDDALDTLSIARQIKYADNVEPATRSKVQSQLTHAVDLNFRSAGGLAEALGVAYCKAVAQCYDPHTEYFPLTEKENFESELGQQGMAFGFRFKEDNDGTPRIENIQPGSPAFKSGQINKGDRIRSVQWGSQQPIDVSAGSLKELYDVLRMSNHEKATFKIQKADGSERTVVLYKEKTADDENKVKSFLLKGSKTIGFISLPAFYEDWEDEETGVNGCANDVAKEILKLKKEHIEGLILDIRYNGGGSVKEAADLAGIFIDAGPVAQFKGRDPKIFALKDMNRGSIWDGPLLLLVNGYSASASEMLAGTLQDYNRALIVGAATYGKATAQSILPLDTTAASAGNFSTSKATSFIKLTISQLYRVTGATAQAKGVQPDIPLPDILDAVPQREADEPNVLISSPVEGNKYFKAGTPLETGHLKSLAQDLVAHSPFFTALKKYLADLQTAGPGRDVSLQLTEALKEKAKEGNQAETAATDEKEKPPYTVQSNQYDLQQMQSNETLKDISLQWSDFLEKDPYLHIAYSLIVNMK